MHARLHQHHRKHWVTEFAFEDAGAAALDTWNQISRGTVLSAGLAQSDHGPGETCRIIFNPRHMISVHTVAGPA